jgi:hypothetical protein
MKRLRKVKRVLPDEATLRAWEDERIEVLHEIEEGGFSNLGGVMLELL